MTQLSSEVRGLLGDAAWWRLAGLLLECPSPEWRERVPGLAGEVDDPRLKQAAGHALEEASEGLYHSTFGPGGPAPPREVSYIHWAQPGFTLSGLRGFYDAFGYRTATAEPLDHVAVEAGFLSYLRLKQAYATTSGDAEAARIAEEAATQFLGEHISAIAERLSRALDDAPARYLAETGRAILDRVGPAPKRAELSEPLVQIEGAEFSCG